MRAALTALALLLAATAAAESLFEPPAVGSYELPELGRLQARALVGPSGVRVKFPGLARGQSAVVALVYGSCHEATGCPLAQALLRDLDRRLAADPARKSRVRLFSVHFDPEHDTPETLSAERDMFAPQTDWQFLVPAKAELAGLLRDFGQDVFVEAGGVTRHVLKVYLVDSRLRIRNVYSAGNLKAELVLADLDTLAGEFR
jgi:cytochrome oxidase Cu insertion factor (SCO1/SenC/PrrC family)